jgi:DNA-binding GntR family transcriptional regulator
MSNAFSSGFSAPTYARLRDQIRSDVVSGVWSLGQHMTMAELSSHYGVSANPVREALHQLQGEGVVEMRENRGAVVRQVDPVFVKNVYDVRGAIEGMLVAEATRRATAEDLAAIEVLIEKFEVVAKGGTTDAIVRANRELHRTINVIADNPVASEIFDGRSTLIDALRLKLGTRPGRLDIIIAEHRNIFNAIKSRDPERAFAVAQAHTRSARDHMLQNINEAAGTVPA